MSSAKIIHRYRSIKEVCEEFGVSRSTVYTWMKAGLLPEPVQITRRCVRFLAEDLEALNKELISKGRKELLHDSL